MMEDGGANLGGTLMMGVVRMGRYITESSIRKRKRKTRDAMDGASSLKNKGEQRKQGQMV
jgi:hypothetical protein